jgi:hypothetical protein
MPQATVRELPREGTHCTPDCRLATKPVDVFANLIQYVGATADGATGGGVLKRVLKSE